MNVNELFAFANKPDKDALPNEPWERLDWNAEFQRQQVNNAWKESNFNYNYAYCDTYPEQL